MMRSLITIAALLACSGAWAKVDLGNSFLLSPGMSKQEVLEVMGGRPAASEFVGELEEWHFCKEFFSQNTKHYATVFFFQGKVIAMKEYGVEKRGTCTSNIKGGSYREPDVVKEYRIKMQ
tara:strand:+ start:30 stop:389 length:360 start_codon:yes stop_codon:yes gene_type:complete